MGKEPSQWQLWPFSFFIRQGNGSGKKNKLPPLVRQGSTWLTPAVLASILSRVDPFF